MEEERNTATETSAVIAELEQERGILRRVSRTLGFTDFMAALMVAATAFSAYSTWRTASIAQAIYQASERAYFGVQSIWIDRSHPDDPRVEIDFRNFGNVAAQDVKIVRLLKIGGVVVKDASKILNAGILSPSTPHRFHLHLPAASFPAITNGKSSLRVEVAASFVSAQRRMCYLEQFTYVLDESDFLIDGGTTACDAADAVEREVAASLPPATS